MDEIHVTTRQGNQVWESKSTRLLRFSSVSGKDLLAHRSTCKVERSTSRLPTVQRIQRVFVIEGEPIEFEWTMFAGLTNWELVKQVQTE